MSDDVLGDADVLGSDGWQKIDGAWYYFKPDGSLVSGGWYYISLEEFAMIEGLHGQGLRA